MRPIGTLQDQVHAERFGDFLFSRGIDNQIDPTSGGSWEVWILDDANVETSKALLDQFHRDPADPVFAQASRLASRQRRQDEATQLPKRNRVVDATTMLYTPPVPLGPLTIALVVISIAVAVITNLGKDPRFVKPLSISERASSPHRLAPRLPEVRQGEIWRLFTPMFLHFGPLHILFNMLWLWDLGSMIETYKSPRLLLALVLVVAGTSNLAQYLASGPMFGGMSGVNYGLLGYVWMQGRFNPASKLVLHPQTVSSAIVWFFLCLFGLIPGIANTVHAVGFAVGIAWGFIDARVRVMLRRY